MKTKIIIDLKTQDKELIVQYRRKDLEKPVNVDEEMMIKYIMGVVRVCIDNGFAMPKPKEEENGKSVEE